MQLDTRPTIHLLALDQFPIFYQLQIEEALLRADDRNWCILNSGTSPAIVMGISGVHEKLINPQLMMKQPVPLIRRFSGGGTVFVDRNTFFATWICNTFQFDVCCCPKKIHEWTAGFYQKAFLGFDMALRENDFVIGERKWGGNAQYLCRGRWLHHTSMLWDYDPENMDYLLMPAKVPAYRQSRGHSDFLCTLREYFSSVLDIKEAIIDTLHAQFDVKIGSLSEISEILQKPHRQATCFVRA